MCCSAWCGRLIPAIVARDHSSSLLVLWREGVRVAVSCFGLSSLACSPAAVTRSRKSTRKLVQQYYTQKAVRSVRKMRRCGRTHSEDMYDYKRYGCVGWVGPPLFCPPCALRRARSAVRSRVRRNLTERIVACDRRHQEISHGNAILYSY